MESPCGQLLTVSESDTLGIGVGPGIGKYGLKDSVVGRRLREDAISESHLTMLVQVDQEYVQGPGFEAKKSKAKETRKENNCISVTY